MTITSTEPICFGDVVKLSAKSAFADSDAETNFLGFIEQKKELLLVVAPVKDDVKFFEAEFVVSAVRGDKAPLPGTPLNYKQPFVLKTSDGSGYSLNNKTPNMTEVVSLREMGIKGEMYVAVEKEGFGQETQVHDGDMSVELHVVDSNRIRKTYDNVSLKHVAKPKSDAPGGFVTCGGTKKKAHVLNFKIVKVAGKTETSKHVTNPVFRRASQLLDPKADETSEASVLESPSRAGSISVVTAGPLVPEDSASAPSSPKAASTDAAATATATAVAETKVETPETAEMPAADNQQEVAAPASTVSTAATTSAEATPVAVASSTTETTTTTTTAPPLVGVDPAALTAQLLQTVEKTPEVTTTTTTTTTSVVVDEMQAALATIELSAASVSDAGNVDGSVPVHDKLAVHTAHTKPVAAKAESATANGVATEMSELDTLSGLPPVPEEHLETACAGKCAIM